MDGTHDEIAVMEITEEMVMEGIAALVNAHDRGFSPEDAVCAILAVMLTVYDPNIAFKGPYGDETIMLTKERLQ